MKLQNSFLLREYLRPQVLPTTWCPGCGLGVVMSSITQAVHYRGLAKRDVAMVSGIGCTGRMSGYVDFNTLHTTHGRAPAFATGLKMARPDMTVLVVMGDGDSMSIGGNHLVHAMRRNIGLKAIVVNNSVYGLTGGQASPTTPVGGRTTTSRPGSFERPMNLEALARASGAAYFARATVNHTAALVKLIERALAVPGFAMVEVVSNCHVLYGRMNDLGDAAQMMQGMEPATRRVNPVLLRRAALPHRLSPGGPATGGDTSGAGATQATLADIEVRVVSTTDMTAGATAHAGPIDHASPFEDDPRIARGVIFERAHGDDYSARYHAMVARRALDRAAGKARAESSDPGALATADGGPGLEGAP